VTNVAYLQANNNYVNIGNFTLANINASIAAEVYPVQPCPVSAPVYDGVQCVACPPQTFYFLNNFTCFHPAIVSNISALNATNRAVSYGGISLTALNDAILLQPYPVLPCPASAPLYNGTNCLYCPPRTYYLLSNFTCYTPLKVTNVTQLNKANNYVNVGGANLAFINTTISASVLPVRACPASAPLFNGTACLGCRPGQYYNLGNLSCQNPNIISNVIALKLSNNYLDSPNYNMSTLQAAVLNVPYPFTECPASAPLFNGSACIVCSSMLYDILNKACANCVSGYFYNTTAHICSPTPQFYPNLNTSTWIVNNATDLQILKNLTNARKVMAGAQMCPNSTPDYNNNTNTCQSCPAGEYWNYNNYSCMACPPNMTVDYYTRTCAVKTVGVYQTSINSPNLLFGGFPRAQWQSIYDANLAKYPGIKDCPPATPYFDGFGCIACGGNYTLFSLLNQACTLCPTGSSYHPNSNACISNSSGLYQSPPNIAKMYSSIF
jgi:hypothetical protein